MSIRNADKYDKVNDPVVDRLRRKSSQAWDLAGLARQDGDTVDEANQTAAAREYDRQLSEYLNGHA